VRPAFAVDVRTVRLPALARGFWHAHMGWIFERDLNQQHRFAPDMCADRDIRIVHRLFGLCTAITMLAPAVIAGS